MATLAIACLFLLTVGYAKPIFDAASKNVISEKLTKGIMNCIQTAVLTTYYHGFYDAILLQGLLIMK